MLDKLSSVSLVSNAIVLVVLAFVGAAAIDYAAGWMGYRSSLVCGLLPHLIAFCWTVAIATTLPGAVLCLKTRSRRGAGWFLAGLVIGALPALASGCMPRLFALGCNV